MTEAEFLAEYDPAAYERPALAVDLVLLGLRAGRLAALLLKRDQLPHAGRWALPGGFVGIDQTLDAAALHVLQEKAGIARAHLEQLYTFGALDRDPRMRIISVAYLALLPEADFAKALERSAALMPATIAVPWPGETGGEVTALSPKGETLPLAFDHAAILAMAILRFARQARLFGCGLCPPARALHPAPVAGRARGGARHHAQQAGFPTQNARPGLAGADRIA